MERITFSVLIEFLGGGKRYIPVSCKAKGEFLIASIRKDGYYAKNIEDGIGVWHNPNYITNLEIISRSE